MDMNDPSLMYTSEELNAARSELQGLVTTLYSRLDQLVEVEDDFELDPDKNIIDNFNCKRQMKCDKCNIQFTSWSEIDLHNSTRHDHEAEDPRVCNVCSMNFSNWQERDTHMLVQHSIDSRYTPAPSVQNYTALWCCSMCSQHFVDQDHWKKHYDSFHARFMGHKTYNWMINVCDIKGRGIVNDSNAKLYCTLCEQEFSYTPDVFNFDGSHGKSNLHTEKVKEFVAQNNRLPVKFIKITNLDYEITGLFHPHELQSSCCCRALACEFCGIHKSMINKFPNDSVVWCNICETNLKWDNVENGIDHVKSEVHYKKLCQYVLQHGLTPPFNAMFKKQGQFIEALAFSRSRRVA